MRWALLLLVGCEALPDLPDVKPDFQEPAQPFEDCEAFCAAPERGEPEGAESACLRECEVAEVDCPEGLQEVYDCWFAWRTNARLEGAETPVSDEDCLGLQFDLGVDCGVDLIDGGETGS